MQTTIQKWGNSQAVRLPKSILELLLLKENDPVHISTKDDAIIIKKINRKRRAKTSLEERFENWNGTYSLSDEDNEWLNSEPVGRELKL